MTSKALPTAPGAYNDASGMLDPDGVWRGVYGDPMNPDLLPVPLRRLVPENKIPEGLHPGQPHFMDDIEE